MISPQHPLTVGTLFGPYRLDRLIGRGGMGEVYQAYDTVKDRTVAIKVLPERLAQDPVYRQRFQRESRTAARLREAHVIPIHDYGEIDGRLFIDMRLVDGDSLRALLRRFGPGAPDRAVLLIEQVAAALDAAHADGLLHRDVKPDNILLTQDGFAYLVDFGIAQSATDESLTSDGSAVGSFVYMAPERFSSRDFGPASDVYALACVLYESLTGTRPFTGETDAQMMRAHLFDPPPSPSRVRPGVSAAFDQVVARGLAKNPNERYRTAGELAAAARAALTRLHTDPTVAESHSMPTEPVRTPAPREPSRPDIPLADTGQRGRPGRLRGALAVLLTLGMVAAATGFAAWAWGQRVTAGTAVGDAEALRGADIDLLSLLPSFGYKRNNCLHVDPDATTVAVINCAENPATDEPLASFRKFKTAEDLKDFYDVFVLGSFKTDGCGVDATARDIPSRLDGVEVGRMACYDDATIDPSAPMPTLVVTNNELATIGMYFFDSPGRKAVRDYVAKVDGAQFRAQKVAQDPDVFTDADRAVLAQLNGNYNSRNCIHVSPVAGTFVSSSLACGNSMGNPIVSFLGYADQSDASSAYQAQVAQAPGRVCGGGTGSDTVWRRGGETVGRFTCYTNNAVTPARTCVMAVHDEHHLAVLVCTMPAEYPEPGPKSESELLSWFQQNFG
ncbi:protein kinase [Nocardia sp. 2]|uniref:non-specific serine/threonine protein kinase n=1 Tax=Nocardia acididurans TaxID=2802282 RepID=A0ABS1MDK7_9NOCA|nr:serine/threonine-protein kinase [Nocardia acididurans]MBL1078656.1 protein kinase [Nocardia acididurans]